MEGMERKTSRAVSFCLKELITCGAVLSTFELVQALRRIGHEAYIASDYRNEELESYFGIELIREPKGITIAVSPRCEGEWAYVRTKDERWKSHQSKKIAVSKYLADWIGTDIVIGNGTHERFYDIGLERDIDVLIVGNYEPNKNIDETIREAKKLGNRVAWMGRATTHFEGIARFESPKIEEIPKIYNRAKIFLSMSKDEGWGRPIAEAVACGVPRVINRNGGNREIEVVSWDLIANQLIQEIC
jgi:glycosyltransferase involved in cell wall biosynthesis